MAKWKRPFKLIYKTVKNPFKRLKLLIKQRLGWLNEPLILPFRGYGNSREVRIKGRILENSGLEQPAEDQNLWHNLLAMLKRYVSDEIPGVKISVRLYDYETVVESDEDGVFEATFNLEKELPNKRQWHEVQFKLLDAVVPEQPEITATGEVMIDRTDTQFGIISDVDDTFLVSHSTNTLKKVRLMLTKNARTRIPFEGVARFYQALTKGTGQNGRNPIFFVSSSEWNLYDMLRDFCIFHGIPKGPFLLQDLKTNLRMLIKSGGGTHEHKLIKIRDIMKSFSKTNFILVGDSGQRDPEIYSKIVQEFPGRVLSIYIRDISKDKRRAEIRQISDSLSKNVEMLLVKDTVEAARHAIQNGYIDTDELPGIQIEKEKDRTAPSDMESMLNR